MLNATVRKSTCTKQTLLNRRNDLNNVKTLFICKLFISLNLIYTQLCFWTYYDGSKSVSFKFHVSLNFLGSSDVGLSLNDFKQKIQRFYLLELDASFFHVHFI